MELFFYLLFGGLSSVLLGLELSKSNKDRVVTSQAFNSFKNNYLVVYSLMMGRNQIYSSGICRIFHHVHCYYFP